MISNVTITQFCFFLAVVMFVGSFYEKNSKAAIFRRKVFRYLNATFNRNALLASFNLFFSSIKASFLALRRFIKKLKR